MRQGRNRSRLRPDAHRLDESAASYSLAGCSPAEPASASPAGFNAGPNGRNSQPPLQRGWGIFDRRFGEFSTGVDSFCWLGAVNGKRTAVRRDVTGESKEGEKTCSRFGMSRLGQLDWRGARIREEAGVRKGGDLWHEIWATWTRMKRLF